MEGAKFLSAKEIIKMLSSIARAKISPKRSISRYGDCPFSRAKDDRVLLKKGKAMSTKKYSLAKAVKELRAALDDYAPGREKARGQRLEQTLAAMEEGARQHRACLKDSEGRVVDVDTSLNPSPGVSRRVEELWQELDNLLQEIRSLREKAENVHPSTAKEDVATVAGSLPVAPEAADGVDFAVFRARVERLVEGFEHFDEEEARLIQESITMDLGAGD
jgi:hypothetical protein